jgi:3-deoxy-D-manno-octulosonic-acid transferase
MRSDSSPDATALQLELLPDAGHGPPVAPNLIALTDRGSVLLMDQGYFERERQFHNVFLLEDYDGVPRHPERALSICEVVQQKGLRAIRWSEVADSLAPLAPDDVLVVDTIGQLQCFYAACDVAFVGGSLVPHGGQNMLEPAALGRAVIFGPHTANFRRDVELLLTADAVVQVPDRAQFATHLESLLRDEQLCAGYGERARRVIAQNQGATARTFDLVVDLVDAARHER